MDPQTLFAKTIATFAPSKPAPITPTPLTYKPLLQPGESAFAPQAAPLFASVASKLATPVQKPAASQFDATPFEKTLQDTVNAALVKAGSAVKNIAVDAATNVKDAVTGKLPVSPADFLQGVKQTAYGLGNGIDTIAKGFNEGVERILKSGAVATLGEENTNKIADAGGGFVHNLSETLTGRQQIATYQDIHKMATDYAEKNDASPHEVSTFGGLAVLGAMFADNPLMGPEKAGLELTEDAVRALAKTTDELEIKNILRSENPKLSEIQLDALAPVYKNVTTPEAVHLVTQQVDKVAKQVVKLEDLPTADTLLKPAESIPKELEPLAAEARKYSSAVNYGKGGHVLDELPKNTPTITINSSLLGKEIDLDVRDLQRQTTGRLRSNHWLNKIENGERPPILIHAENGKLKVVDGNHRASAYLQTGIKDIPVILTKDAKSQLTDLYNTATEKSVGIETSARVNTKLEQMAGKARNFDDFYERAGVTRESLDATAVKKGFEDAEDFYNKNKNTPILPVREVKKVEEPNKGFSPNLVRDISESKDPYQISDILQKEFPNLSEPAVVSIAKKLKDVKRTADVEGILKTVRSAVKSLKSPARTFARQAEKLAQNKVVPGLAKAISDVLSPEQLDIYLDTATRAVRTPDQAVLAQQEYDALWEVADQRVVDRLNEATIERDIYREQLNLHPGKELTKYVSKTTGKLPEITGKDTMQALTGSGKTVKTGKFGTGGDQIIKDLGYESDAQAQSALDDYTAMRTRVTELDQEIRDLRPKARAARILQSMQDEVPVIARKQAGEIDTLVDPDAIRYEYKDISGVSAGFRDVYRNFKQVFGDKYAAVKKTVLDPFDASKGALVDEVHAMGDDIAAGVVDKYGFNRGGKEDKAIMDYGERQIAKNERVPGMNFDYTTKDGLVKAFGTKKANQIIEAEGWFRKTYDRLIDEANEVRAKIYPNQPSKLIPKRQDYFRHFKEVGGDFRGLLDIFETPAGIDPGLAGISEFTKPSSKFLGFAQERLGQGSERSAIGGFLDYAPAFAYMKHIDPHIGNFRYLRRKLAENSPTPGVTEFVEKGDTSVKVKQKGINNFLEYLDDFSNELGGKTVPLDRWVQKRVPGGRATLKVINWTNSRIKSNQILGNFSSSVAQLFNLPQGIGSAKLYMVPGAQRTLASIFEKNAPMEASSFLKERYATPLTNRFKLDWAEHPIKGSVERGKEKAAWVTGVLDEVATKWMWNAHYAKGVAENVADPIKYADDTTRALVAGRGIGEVPIEQKSKILNLVIPFTLEVTNSWYVMKDFVKAKDFVGLATFFAASYLMNEGAEKVRGSRVVFDPINSMIEGLNQFADELENDGSVGRATIKFTGRQAGEILQNVPFGNIIAAAIPDNFNAPFVGPMTRQELFGNGDPGRFGNPLLVINSLNDPFYKMILPFGGAQVERTKQAVESMLKGSVNTGAGKLSFKTPTDPVSVVQAFLFGKNSTAAAQKAYAERDDLFTQTYRQDANRTQLTLDGETEWTKIKDLKTKQGGAAAADELIKLAKDNPQLAQKVADIGTEEAKGLDSNDRLVSMLGVENGERASFIVNQLKKIKDGNEKAQFVQNLAQKGLMSDAVIKQVTYLLTQQ